VFTSSYFPEFIHYDLRPEFRSIYLLSRPKIAKCFDTALKIVQQSVVYDEHQLFGTYDVRLQGKAKCHPIFTDTPKCF